ncbi:hypothetical protein RRG08_066716 [Elysia crispata]|uniref:Uncharacterized protein n=1 Tax=Elysia crispata TaxID=231223 RepID=A0AAE1EBL9_9GAST|nr:hypothetical protein RRG08_066716 [Elysia crispata]
MAAGPLAPSDALREMDHLAPDLGLWSEVFHGLSLTANVKHLRADWRYEIRRLGIHPGMPASLSTPGGSPATTRHSSRYLPLGLATQRHHPRAIIQSESREKP